MRQPLFNDRVNILVLAPDYPKPGSPSGGVFNEESVAALKALGNRVEVLVPRPYAPRLVSSLAPRWRVYGAIPTHEVRKGVQIHRPAYPQIPQVASALWREPIAFLFCRSAARKIHHYAQFDAILSFDLAGAGGLAWRIGRDLNIPAAGWATGGDVRFPNSSHYGQNVKRTIKTLNVVFYQSNELLAKAAALLGLDVESMDRDRHIVLPRGIRIPPRLCRDEIRRKVRADLGIRKDQSLIVSIGRISRDKGAFDLLDAVSLATAKDERINCIMVGSNPAFDESIQVKKYLDKNPHLKERLRILPACSHDEIWKYLCAADIFAFTSHHEGMPNSLLEALIMGVPSVAFAIPAVLEIAGDTGGLISVPPFDSHYFAEVLLRLTSNRDEGLRIAKMGQQKVFDNFMAKKNMAEATRRLQSCVNARKYKEG